MTSNELVLLLTLVLIRTVFDGLTYKVLKGPDGVENGMISLEISNRYFSVTDHINRDSKFRITDFEFQIKI